MPAEGRYSIEDQFRTRDAARGEPVPSATEEIAARVRAAGVELRNPAIYAHYYFLVDDREQQVCLPVDLDLPTALIALSAALKTPVTAESLLNVHPSGRIVLTTSEGDR